MIMNVHHYDCECGWSGHWLIGGSRRKRTLIEEVEQQLTTAKHPRARSVWRILYKQILKEEKAEAYGRTGMAVCFHCKTNQEQLAVYDKGLILHPLPCQTCGNEVAVYHEPESLPCPSCKTVVKAGPALSTEALLQRKLARCKITLLDSIGETGLIAVGSRTIAYLEPIKQDLPFSIVTIEKGEGGQRRFILDVKKVFLQTSFENSFEAELAIILSKQLGLMGIEVVPVIITPPIFEGKRRLDKVMEYIKEIQRVSKETILVSGAALEREFGSSVEIYNEHIPMLLRDILKKKG